MKVTPEPLVLSPEAEQQALKDLLESDGWAIYVRRGSSAWGPEACEQALREARKNADPAEWPFESMRILDTFAAMRAELSWPAERLRSLVSGEAVLRTKAADRFATLRRTGGAR